MIKEVYVSDFRNLKDKKILLSPGFNLIYGQNAQGKTSFMESIYFCATGKSFRTKKKNEMIKYEKENAKVFIKLLNMSTYSINLFKDNKKCYKNGQRIKYADYIGNVIAISFIPEDVELVMGNPAIRREFFNYEISQTDKIYLNHIIEYEKVLRVRNKLLKEKKVYDDIFKIYNEKYINLCVEILKIRKEYIDNLNNIVDSKYKELFNENHSFSLIYDNFLRTTDFSNLRENIEKILDNKLDLDIKNGYSNYGVHKDDYIFLLNGKNARHYSSQGEKKSIVFVIKIAEVELMEEKFHKKPIFLMDDITSFFDNFRKNQIINYFLEKEIQCFLTATEDLKIVGKKFNLEGGLIYDR